MLIEISLILLLPLATAILLLWVKESSLSSWLSIASTVLTFVVLIKIMMTVHVMRSIHTLNDWIYVDHLSVFMLFISCFIALTTAIYAKQYFINEPKPRYFDALYQFFLFIAIVVLVSNNIGIIWVGMECATLATVLMVSLNRTTKSLEASWKYLILCGLGLAQALLGTILLYFATEKVLLPEHALLWSHILTISQSLEAPIIGLSFVFLLVGFGTKAGFVPLHHWLPDAYAESMAPVLCVLSGILLNLSIYVILRYKMLVDAALGSEMSNAYLLAFGLLNVIVAAFFLLRQREVKRLFAYSSIEHIGIICFAFGINTSLAIFAGLLHLFSHALAKTSAFFSIGNIIQIRQKYLIEDIHGAGWGLLLSTLALLGMPPFALFVSEFMIIFEAVKYQLWLAVPLIIGLMISFGALLNHVQDMTIYKEDSPIRPQHLKTSVFPIVLHLAVLASLGIVIPVFLKNWFDPIILLLSNST